MSHFAAHATSSSRLNLSLCSRFVDYMQYRLPCLTLSTYDQLINACWKQACTQIRTLPIHFCGFLDVLVFHYCTVPRGKKQLDPGCLHCHCLAKSSLYRHTTLFLYDYSVHTQGRSAVHHQYHVHIRTPVTSRFHIDVDEL